MVMTAKAWQREGISAGINISVGAKNNQSGRRSETGINKVTVSRNRVNGVAWRNGESRRNQTMLFYLS